MKLKNKILLAAASLLVVSGSAAATGTFAWFTAQQTAKTALTTIKAMSGTSALGLAVTTSDTTLSMKEGTGVAGTDGVIRDTTYEHASTDTGSSAIGYNLTDISGDGKTFYRPALNVDENGSLIGFQGASLVKATDYKAPYLYEFTLSFTSSNYTAANAGTNLAVFLDPASTITDVTASTPIAGAVRVAFTHTVGETTSVIGYYMPNDTIGATYTYLSSTGAATSLVSGICGDVMDSTYASATPNKDADTKATYTAGTTKGYLGTTGSDGSLSVKMRIWIEGQDTDCSTANVSGKFNVNLKFYAVSAYLA